jgi:hypothetical protein
MFRRLAWIVPCAVLGSIGVLANVPRYKPASTGEGALVWAMLMGTAVVVGAICALIARSRGALVANVAIASLMALAWGIGTTQRQAREADAARLAGAAARASGQGGWYGAVTVGSARIFAKQIETTSDLGKMLTSNFDLPLQIFVVGVDNRAGTSPITIDLATAKLELADESSVAPLDRLQVFAKARQGRSELEHAHAGTYVVAPGQSLGNAMLFLPATFAVDRLRAITMTIDGRALAIQGRMMETPAGGPLR